MSAISISRAITAAALADPHRPAVTCGNRTVTRSELDRRTNRLARAYADLGVRAGDYVTIGLPNSIEFYEVAIAAWKLGAVPQPISHRLPDREREAIVELARPALVVGAAPSAHDGMVCVPAGWEPDAALSDDELPDVVAPTWKAPTSGGSTGRPKLIVSGDPGLVIPGQPASGLRVDGSVCIPGPLYHNAPFAFSAQALFHGNHVCVLEKFDAEATLAAIERHRADWVLLVPTMMQRIWRLPESVRLRYDVSSLQTVWHMAAPCPPWLKQAWIEWIGAERIWELYAGTEAQAVTIIRGDEWLAHQGSVGRCVIGEMRILDPDTFEERPAGSEGEVFMRSTSARPTYRYVGADSRRSPDGWESLGDMGWFDADGYLYLGDRRADMILSGGANIYPAEVEAAIDEHPDVRSCAVIGIPDDDLGNRIHAIVQTVSPVSDDDLRTFLAERLVRYKIPRTFEFTDTPVRDDAGKVRRSALREERTA
jgi:bile acid-coenzyme A ligase